MSSCLCIVYANARNNVCKKERNFYQRLSTRGYRALRSLGIVQETPPTKKSDMIRKLIAMMIYAILFALVLYFINGITKFLNAMITAYLLWLVVDWYDFLVIDILLAPFDKFYKMAKVSPFEKSAVWFHFKGSVKGMIIGIVFAPIVGLIVMLMNKLIG